MDDRFIVRQVLEANAFDIIREGVSACLDHPVECIEHQFPSCANLLGLHALPSTFWNPSSALIRQVSMGFLRSVVLKKSWIETFPGPIFRPEIQHALEFQDVIEN